MLQQKIVSRMHRLGLAFKAGGYECSLIFEPEKAREMLKGVGKDNVHPVSWISDEDLRLRQAFWLSMSNEAGFVMCISARLIDLQGEDFSSYWREHCRLIYPDRTPPVSQISEELSSILTGKLVYFGGVHVEPSQRGDVQRLRRFVELAKLHSADRWAFDWLFTIINASHLPLARIYGFDRRFPRAVKWCNPIPDGLANDQVYLTESLARISCKLGAEPS